MKRFFPPSRIYACGFVVTALMLAGCGGSNNDNSFLDGRGDTPPTSSSNPTPNSSSQSLSSSPSNISSEISSSFSSAANTQLGRFSDTQFVAGEIDIAGAEQGVKLSARGSTQLTLVHVDESESLNDSPLIVSFASLCAAKGKASFRDSDDQKITSAALVNGRVIVTYKDEGCGETDTITATSAFQGKVLSAQSQLDIARDTVQSIQYISATPEQLSLKGTGGSESSTLVFEVIGSTGHVVQGADVELSLNSDLGGACLSTSSISECTKSLVLKSDANGKVNVLVHAGTIASPVGVTAKDLASNIYTASNMLSISTGIPDQNSFSLSLSNFNPHAWESNEPQVTVNARLADAFNNPPPVGTTISFWTDGGSIQPSCQTDKDGACNVQWFAGEPRPAGGLATILAFAQGNESFIDTNGDGYYEQGVDKFTAMDDLPEAFLDRNKNSMFDLSEEEFIDFNKNGVYDESDGKYNGVLCKDESTNGCTKTGVTVRRSSLLAMSSSLVGRISFTTPLTISENETKTFTLIVSDQNGNSLPSGSSITIENNEAQTNVEARMHLSTVNEKSDPSANEFNVIISHKKGSPAPTGNITVVVTTPNRVTSDSFSIN
jgi:hypothetical protein